VYIAQVGVIDCNSIPIFNSAIRSSKALFRGISCFPEHQRPKAISKQARAARIGPEPSTLTRLTPRLCG